MTLISSEDFPFTAEELHRALSAAYPADEAAKLSAHIAAIAEEHELAVHPVAQEHAGAHQASSRSTLFVPLFVWALVAASSPTLEQRCDEWRRRARDTSRAARERTVREEHGIPSHCDLPAEFATQLDVEDAAVEREWSTLLEHARRLQGRLEP